MSQTTIITSYVTREGVQVPVNWRVRTKLNNCGSSTALFRLTSFNDWVTDYMERHRGIRIDAITIKENPVVIPNYEHRKY